MRNTIRNTKVLGLIIGITLATTQAFAAVTSLQCKVTDCKVTSAVKRTASEKREYNRLMCDIESQRSYKIDLALVDAEDGTYVGQIETFYKADSEGTETVNAVKLLDKNIHFSTNRSDIISKFALYADGSALALKELNSNAIEFATLKLQCR